MKCSKFIALALAFALCGVPEMLAQQTAPATPQQPPATDQSQDAAAQQKGTTVDPSVGPLEPVPTDTNADANPAPAQQVPNAPSADKPKPQPQKPAEPVGVGVAERGKTVGGVASKPAGSPIAPAKQRQTRALLIKVGAVAGAAVALGTIYALSRGTPSTPPAGAR